MYSVVWAAAFLLLAVIGSIAVCGYMLGMPVTAALKACLFAFTVIQIASGVALFQKIRWTIGTSQNL